MHCRRKLIKVLIRFPESRLIRVESTLSSTDLESELNNILKTLLLTGSNNTTISVL